MLQEINIRVSLPGRDEQGEKELDSFSSFHFEAEHGALFLDIVTETSTMNSNVLLQLIQSALEVATKETHLRDLDSTSEVDEMGKTVVESELVDQTVEEHGNSGVESELGETHRDMAEAVDVNSAQEDVCRSSEMGHVELPRSEQHFPQESEDVNFSPKEGDLVLARLNRMWWPVICRDTPTRQMNKSNGTFICSLLFLGDFKT